MSQLHKSIAMFTARLILGTAAGGMLISLYGCVQVCSA